MATGLFVFTMLWVVSCSALYEILRRKVEKQVELTEEAMRMHKGAQVHYDKAIAANAEAQALNKQLQLRWQQMEVGLTCLN